MSQVKQLDETTGLIQKTQHQTRITLLLAVVIFFSVLNGTMFHVAVPDIAAEFGLLPSEVSWVVTSYIVVFALGSITYGKLADSYPVKWLITLGLLLLNAGSLLGVYAHGFPMLVAARLLQASGGASIPALAMLVATKYFPGGVKGRVLGVISSTVALGTGLGPLLGGSITDNFHWRYLFVLTIVTLVTIPFFRKWLPEERKTGTTFDFMGLCYLGGSVTSFLLFVTQLLWWLLPAGILLLITFVLHIQKTAGPFVNPSLFMNRSFRNTLITAFLAMGTVFGMMFLIPMMLKNLNQLNADQIGLVMFPGAIMGAILGIFGGRLTDRFGSVPVVYTGLGLLILGFITLSLFAGSSSFAVCLILIVCYIGFTFSQSSLTHTISAALTREEMGVGMGIYNLVFFLSGAFSAAILGKLLDITETPFSLNPFLVHRSAALYSNLFVLLAISVLFAASLFCFTFYVLPKHE